MKCPGCQGENREGRRFCAECGESLALACPSCSFSNEPGEKFCGGYGTPLGAPVGTSAGSRFNSPEAYTPKHLAEKILTSKAALEGERKQVTVLFADLKGSMELLADRDPEEARKLLDPVIEHMMESVHRYEGTVNQVMGDGIMALFGAPLAHEDHAVRACYAALRMQESVKRYAEDARRGHGVNVEIRVGLNSGEVVVRAIGSDLHMDYTAVGQTTHLAARAEQLAAAGTTLLTPATLRLAEGRIEVKPLGPVPIKGLAEPIEVYELIGAGSARTRLHAAGLQGLTRFVGRDTEMEQLRHALALVETGHGQIVTVVGEPGVGKSRLLYEFTRAHRTLGWRVLESSSLSYGKATPYLPVIDLLKSYLRVDDRDEPRDVREKVTGKLLTLDESLRSSLTPILALLDGPVEDPRWQTLEPPQRKHLTRDAVRRVLLRESQVQPLVLVFEDLHWVDSESQEFLDSLVDSLPSARVLLLVSYRTEYQHRWGSGTHYTQLRIDPLPPEPAQELLASLLGTDPALAPLKHQLIERTDGNPFFIEESVRTLVETQALVGDRGAYRSGRGFGTFQVPATVQAVLAARIDRLPADDKRLLQTAAVVGKHVPFTLLQAVGEAPDAELRGGLGRLQSGEFLYEATLFPDLEYRFKHALTHEVAYSSLLQDQRRALHARVVDAIERLYPDRLAEHVDRLAHHALRGERWDQAVAFSEQAGNRAYGHSAYRQALTCFEQALEALRHLPQSRDTVARAIDLRRAVRWALLPLGAVDRMRDELNQALTLAERIGDEPRQARSSADLSHFFWLTGRLGDAIEAGERAQSLARAAGDAATELRAGLYVGQAYHARGEYQRAIDILRPLREALQGKRANELGGPRFSVYVGAWLAPSLATVGQFAEAIGTGEDNVRIAESLDDSFCLCQAYLSLGWPHLYKGNAAEAIRILERLLELLRVSEVTLLVPMSTALLGSAYTLAGRVAEALPLLERAVADDYARPGAGAGGLLRALSYGHLRAGHPGAALDLAQRALDRSLEVGNRGDYARILWLFGEIHAAQDPSDSERSASSYREALTSADELGMRPLVAHCHLGLGKLYRRTGKRDQAHEHLTVATAMYREMDMRFWLEQAEAELHNLA